MMFVLCVLRVHGIQAVGFQLFHIHHDLLNSSMLILVMACLPCQKGYGQVQYENHHTERDVAQAVEHSVVKVWIT